MSQNKIEKYICFILSCCISFLTLFALYTGINNDLKLMWFSGLHKKLKFGRGCSIVKPLNILSIHETHRYCKGIYLLQHYFFNVCIRYKLLLFSRNVIVIQLGSLLRYVVYNENIYQRNPHPTVNANFVWRWIRWLCLCFCFFENKRKTFFIVLNLVLI